MHGGHHVPKKFSTTHEPLRCRRGRTAAPSMVVARTAGAGWSSSGVLAVSVRAALGDGEDHDEQRRSTTATPSSGEQAPCRPRARLGRRGRPPAVGSRPPTSTIAWPAHQLGRRGASPRSLGRRQRRRHRVGRARRRRPGKAASTVPIAMTAPPIHSQSTSGIDAHRRAWSVAVGVGLALEREVDVARAGRSSPRASPIVCPMPGTAAAAGEYTGPPSMRMSALQRRHFAGVVDRRGCPGR